MRSALAPPAGLWDRRQSKRIEMAEAKVGDVGDVNFPYERCVVRGEGNPEFYLPCNIAIAPDTSFALAFAYGAESIQRIDLATGDVTREYRDGNVCHGCDEIRCMWVQCMLTLCCTCAAHMLRACCTCWIALAGPQGGLLLIINHMGTNVVRAYMPYTGHSMHTMQHTMPYTLPYSLACTSWVRWPISLWSI